MKFIRKFMALLAAGMLVLSAAGCAKKEKMLYDRQESKKISIKKYIIISAIVSLIIDLGLLLPRFIKYIPYNEYLSF